jgi:hypothetical protein
MVNGHLWVLERLRFWPLPPALPEGQTQSDNTRPPMRTFGASCERRKVVGESNDLW